LSKDRQREDKITIKEENSGRGNLESISFRKSKRWE